MPQARGIFDYDYDYDNDNDSDSNNENDSENDYGSDNGDDNDPLPHVVGERERHQELVGNIPMRTCSTIILASQSPRRRYLMKQAGIEFSVIPSRCEEHIDPALSPEACVAQLALQKASDIARLNPDAWVIGADTIVVIDGAILGKPSSKAEAKAMLHRLSGRIHQVLTGFSLVNQSRDRIIGRSVSTDVLFKPLSDAEIAWYIGTDEPFDKAGAYALQGIGAFMVKAVYGSYTNVIGLPICELIETMESEGLVRFSHDP